MSEELSEEQVKNWRRVLIGMFGPYALLMPKEQIQMFHDRLAGGLTKRPADEFCTCDQKHHGYTKHLDGSVECNHCHKTRR